MLPFDVRIPPSLFLFLPAALCSGQAPQSVPEKTTTYHSEVMGLDFSYPSSFANKATAESASSREPGVPDKKAAGNCITYPITAMDMRKAFNMIFLKRSDTACLGTEITAAGRETAAVNFLYGLLKEFGKPAVSPATDYDIGGHGGSAVSGSVKVQGDSAGTVIYGAAGCLAAGKNLACFAFLSSDCQTLPVLSASAVKFTDTAATPVIPTKSLPACKP